MHRLTIIVLTVLVLCTAGACREEGPAEKAGRQIDEATESARDSAEGALERLGREVDEAVDETREAAEEIEEAARNAGS